MRGKESARLEELAPAWIEWLCEACSRGLPQADLEALLMERGDQQPAETLRALRAHPIYQWAHGRLKHSEERAQRAETYVALQEALWDTRKDPLPRAERPTSRAFYEGYYCAGRPVVITGWASGWPSASLWSPTSWAERFQGVPVSICAGRDEEPRYDRRFESLSCEVDLGDFARQIEADQGPSNDRYIIARNFALARPELSSLLNDIDEEPYLDRGAREGCVALWFGPRGTYTPLHHDTCQIMFVQVYGDKHFTLIPAHAHTLFKDATNMYSNLPVGRDLSAAPVHPQQIDLTLSAGEALFIPVGWWHAVRALSPAISLAMTHFKRPNRFAWYEPNAVPRTPSQGHRAKAKVSPAKASEPS